MALANSSQAIGAVTRLLIDHLTRRTTYPVNSGRPEDSAGAQTRMLNIFLYEAAFDSSLKNYSLADGRTPPLWLTLKYLLTAFGDDGNSDSPTAHDVLGQGLAALQELAFLGLDNAVAPAVRSALEDNPEPLKLTFDDCNADLINKLTQASDDEYRVSAAFQVRPVMIVPAERPAFHLLVGVDYTTTPLSLTPAPVGLDVLPSLGPRLGAVSPEKFSIGDEFELAGEDLHLSNLSCFLGPVELGITGQWPDRITVRVENALQSGSLLAAGEHPIVLRQLLLGTGRTRASNAVLGRLLPTVTTTVLGVFTADPQNFLSGSVTINGFLLGRNEDSILVALHRNGSVAHLFDVAKPALAPGDPPDSQQQLVLTLAPAARVLAGTYRLMVVVNGQQARQSPTVVLAP